MIEKLLPPRPAPEFEVATLKATAPGATQERIRILPTGMIDGTNVPLRELMNIAWGYNGDEMIIGPKWIETSRFDVVGRAFSGVDAQFVDDEFLRLSLRKLLVDRFKIKFQFVEPL